MVLLHILQAIGIKSKMNDLQTANIKAITDKLAAVTKNDYSQALKLLGFLTFVANEGSELLLSGDHISRQTYYRYVGKIKQAGLGGFLIDIRLQQIITEMVEEKFGGFQVGDIEEQVLEKVANSLEAISSHSSVARSPSALALNHRQG